MKQMKNGIAIVVGVLMSGGLSTSAGADELLWQGAVNSSWDTSTLNWTNGVSSVPFSSGMNARFDDSAVSRTVTLSGAQHAGQVLFENALNYTLANGVLAEASLFVKRGAGELKITDKGHTFTGDVSVMEGTLRVVSGYGLNASNGPLGNPQASRRIFVGTNAVLHLDGNDVLGQVWSHPLAQIVVSGGTLTQTVNKVNCFGPLTLENATLSYSGTNSAWGTLVFDGDVTFKGTNAYNLANVNGSRIRCGRNRMTFFDVADIPGTNIDVTVGMQIDDCIAGSSGGVPFNALPSNLGKKGSGTLRLENRGSTFTGEVDVVEGTLQVAGGFGLNATTGPLGNPQALHRIFVGTNAVLHLDGNDVQGQVWSHPLAQIVVSGGTLTQTVNMVNCFGPLTLENAKLSCSGRNGDWGTLVFDGDVTFKGTNAYNLANVNDSRIRCGRNRMTFFDVADIPGTNIDVTVGMQIDDCIAGSSGGVPFNALPSNLGKKGPGTLRLENHGSTFTGDVEVADGVLQIPVGANSENKTISCLGNPQVLTRCCRVHSGAELSFLQSDTLGQLASSVKMATAISNATLRLANSTCNGFGPLTLHNARVVYNSGTQSFYTNSGVRTWGVMGFGGRTVFSGTNAYTFAVVGNYCRFNLGYALDYSEEDQPGVTNYNGKTEFVVRDISGDVRADVTFEAPLQDIPTWPNAPLFKTVTFKCGLLKSGDGTLRLASTDNTYSGPTVVTQGVLRVDGSLTTSAVTVAAGGYLGGTGTVADVTLEAGAGIDVSANQTVPLTVETLTVAGHVTIVVHNPAGIDRAELNVPLFRVTGSVSGTFDPSAWTVQMDGVASTPNLRMRVDGNGIAYARWSPVGTLIKIF